jgi:hypothetical protein
VTIIYVELTSLDVLKAKILKKETIIERMIYSFLIYYIGILNSFDIIYIYIYIYNVTSVPVN